MNINFKDKVVLVTGSTSGIGRQIAKQLLENQANVIITYGHNEKMACKNFLIIKEIFY